MSDNSNDESLNSLNNEQKMAHNRTQTLRDSVDSTNEIRKGKLPKNVDTNKTKNPIPIVFLTVENAREFTDKINYEYDTRFAAKFIDKLIKHFTKSREIGDKNVNYLKKEKYKFYFVPESHVQLKVLLEELSPKISGPKIKVIL